MELPFSAPRLYIAGLFAVAAVLAGLGAGRMPGRRTWWSAIAVVTAGIAAVKAGSEVHKALLLALDGYAHPVRALALTAPVAALGLASLWWLSRHDRRDRRRVLTALGLYGAASIGLSTLTSLVEGRLGHGHPLTVVATYLEECGEVLAATAVLVAVLVGLTPRLVLPAGRVLRREADRHTLDAATHS